MSLAQSRLHKHALLRRASSSTDIALSPSTSIDEDDSILDEDWLRQTYCRFRETKNSNMNSPLSSCFLDDFTSDEISLEPLVQDLKISSKPNVLRFEDPDRDTALRAACCQAVSLCSFLEWDAEQCIARSRYSISYQPCFCSVHFL